MSLSGNKGEWSEIYALFKLLGETKIYSGDENLNRIESVFYPIIKILRQEEKLKYEYSIDDRNRNIVLVTGGPEDLSLPITKFIEEANRLFLRIKSGNGSFEIPETELFMNSIHCRKIKADSSDKTDIRIMIHDLRTNISPTLGFSIKSQMGSKATLLNAGKTTNFIYKIDGAKLSDHQILSINEIKSTSKIKDRINKIIQLSGSLKYCGMESSIFQNNLIMIDSCMPVIISELLLLYFTGNVSSIKSLCEQLNLNNPLDYNTEHDHNFYEYKIKQLLTVIALGMMPGKVWTGKYDANGGYLIVKSDGDVLCYHIYNRNDFENYLFHNTKFETASSSRHEFGEIQLNDGKQIFKLNTQIRFI